MDDPRARWPVCDEGRVDLQPALAGDRAVWVCPAGTHQVRDIGRVET